MDEAIEFRLSVEWVEDQAVVFLAGEIDLATAPIIVASVDRLFERPLADLAIDLGAVTFLDSTGLAALVKVHSWTVERSIPFTLASISKPARLTLEVTRVDELFGVERQSA